MTNRSSSVRNIRLGAALIAFLAAAAIGSCAGMGEAGAGEHESGGEESGAKLTPDQTYDEVRRGTRLILRYDAAANAFLGEVRNVTDRVLRRVRVEVHLSNGVELGPTEPVDLAPGAARAVRLAATGQAFTGWTPHAEVGGGADGGEHGAGGERTGGEHGGNGGGEGREH